MERKYSRFFCVECTPGVECSSFQFASMVEFHLKCACAGLDCDRSRDWDGIKLFWQSDWMDWSQKQEEDTLSILRFFANRYLREQRIPETRLNEYINFRVITVGEA